MGRQMEKRETNSDHDMEKRLFSNIYFLNNHADNKNDDYNDNNDTKIPDMYCSIMAAFYQFPSSSEDATDIHVHILQ